MGRLVIPSLFSFTFYTIIVFVHLIPAFTLNLKRVDMTSVLVSISPTPGFHSLLGNLVKS